MTISEIKNIKKGFARPTTTQFVILGIGLLVSIGLFIFLRGFISCWKLTALPGIAPSTCITQGTTDNSGSQGNQTGETTTPNDISAPSAELPPPWDGASRVTILFVGLDYRDWEMDQGTPHTDTMIVFTVDPLTKTAGMISIPRDMWVYIPGFGYNKINAAYKLGGDYRLPGGGRALVEKTVENFLGIPIDYFVQTDFETFIKVIDEIGGIDINVPNEIVVGLYKVAAGKVTLQPGLQHLDGLVALGYARNRKTENGDIDRAGRQQQVILAIRDKVISNLPSIIAKAPALYADISAGVNTDLTLTDALKLAVFVAQDIPLNSIQKGIIDYTCMEDGKATVDGQIADILRPYPDKIRELVDQVFGVGSMKPMATGDTTQLMQQEAASVRVINFSGITGLATQTVNYLKTQGMNVIAEAGNHADFPGVESQVGFPLTRAYIIVHTGKPYAIQYLMELFNISSPSQVIVNYDPGAVEDIVVAIGTDWARDNPMPPGSQ